MHGIPMTEERVKAVESLVYAGKTNKEITEITGIAKTTVVKYAGVVRAKIRQQKNNTVPEELWEEWDEVTEQIRGNKKK